MNFKSDTRPTPTGLQVLPWQGVKPWLAALGFVAAAVLLPAAAHLTGMPVRWLLPMHWPVLLAGLLYGWRSGLVVGALAPGTNWLLTGYPLMPKLLPMMVELAIYGAVTGWLRERGWNGFAAVAVALVAGRVFFILMIALTGATDGLGFWAYTLAALTPGLVAGVVQVGMLGWVGKLTGRVPSNYRDSN